MPLIGSLSAAPPIVARILNLPLYYLPVNSVSLFFLIFLDAVKKQGYNPVTAPNTIGAICFRLGNGYG